MAGRHQWAALLASRSGRDDDVLVEDVSRHVSGVDELKPSAEPRNNVLHAGQEGVPIDDIVGIALVVGEAHLVRVRGMLLLPAAHQMRHCFGTSRNPNCKLMWKEVVSKRRQL